MNQAKAEAPPPRGLMVLHSNRIEDLRDLLVQYLKAHPLGPLQPEVILLQSNGMKHWLELALANDDALGICAATQMVLPSAYLWQMYRAVLGAQAVPAHMPFDKTALLWRLVRLLPALCDTRAVYAPLKQYLSGDNAARKLYQLALQVADVFDGYQSYRADWLTDWAGGQDVLRGAVGGAPPPLTEAHRWQAQLWRDLRADVAAQGGAALAEASRAAVHARFLETISQLNHSEKKSALRPSGVPQRLIVFGVSSLPMQAVQALAALGQLCQVMLFVQNPCRYYWGDLVEGHAALRAQVRRRQPVKPNMLAASDAPNDTHPLLAALGKQGRDYLHLLDGFDAPEAYRAHWHRVDVFVDPAGADPASATQLAQLQSAILNLNPPPPTPVDLSDDGSLVLVTAHSAQRELEVLHDRLLAWFDADAALQPRDVMVMVPDMATFAPHIYAVFGRFATGQPRHIPFSVADTTARQSPLVQALEQLLQLPESRLSLADWLSLFEVSAVRTRFGLSEADVRQLQDWLAAAGVRWGFDAAHRVQWGLPSAAPGVAQNTWAFGLRRLLLGYALGISDDALWEDTLAQPALSGLDAPLAAGLLGWLDAVAQTLPTLQADQTPAQWVQTLQALVARFFASDNETDERAITRLLMPLAAWQQTCAQAQCDTPLPLTVVREHWLAQLEQDGLQQRFFGGGVQFGTLMPMRAIPFKVICLLGMNDGDYPRVQAARDFDLMGNSWRAGDRSRREDDRYLFLEALLSARQKLYVSWQGRSAADNSKRPPSVLVAQLLDVVNACWAPARAPQAQPLQPFSKAYFEAGSGVATYDKDWEPIWLEAQVEQVQAAMQSRVTTPIDKAFNSVTLDDLQRLLRQPVEVFFRNRLQVALDRLEDLEQEDEPFALNHLQQHQAGQALLHAAGNPQSLAQLQASGTLPLAGFGQQVATELLIQAQKVLQAQAVWLQQYPAALPALAVNLALPLPDDLGTDPLADAGAGLGGPVQLTGTLNDLRAASNDAGTPCLQLAARIGAVLEGKAGKTARGHVLVKLWVNHLAGCACGLQLTSVQLGVDGCVVLQPMASNVAQAVLVRLTAAYVQALVAPLPVACKAAWAFLLEEQANAARLALGKPPKDPHDAACVVFDTQPGAGFPGEREESAYLQRAFAAYADLADGLPHWARVLYGDLLHNVGVGGEVPS